MPMYRKKALQPMIPWGPDLNMTDVSVSPADKANGSPQDGDMIAHNPKNLTDEWLVSKSFMAENYEEVVE